jgi:transposase-like protein
MFNVINPLAREQTMTKVQDKAKVIAIKELLERNEDFVRSAVQSFVQAALEGEMTEALAAEKGERTEGRLGYRSGYYRRALITRGGCWSFGFRKIARGGFHGAVRAVSALGEGAGWGRWRRCMCKASRRGK